MRKPRSIEFQIGDIIESKRNPTKGERFLIVDKQPNPDMYPYNDKYTAYSFERDDYFGIYTKLTSQHWKIVA